MMKNALLVAAMAAGLVATAHADERSGFYVAADAGQTSLDLSKSDVDAYVAQQLAFRLGVDVVDGVSKLDDSDTTFGVTMGYRFNKHFAVEASYLDLGGAEYQASGLVSDGVAIYDADVGLSVASKGAALSLVGSLPIGQSFEVNARAGGYYGKSEINQSASSVTAGFSGSESNSENSLELAWGVGAAYYFGEHWTANLDYRQIPKVGSDDIEIDVSRATLGLSYKF